MLSASTVPSARYGTWRYRGSARVILSLIPVDIKDRASGFTSRDGDTSGVCHASAERGVVVSHAPIHPPHERGWFGHRLGR